MCSFGSLGLCQVLNIGFKASGLGACSKCKVYNALHHLLNTPPPQITETLSGNPPQQEQETQQEQEQEQEQAPQQELLEKEQEPEQEQDPPQPDSRVSKNATLITHVEFLIGSGRPPGLISGGRGYYGICYSIVYDGI